jgi:parvulin-like peptidyl-prolyl isomerase
MRMIHNGLLIGVGGLILIGCGENGRSSRPLTPADFVERPMRSNNHVNPLDQPGPVLYDQVGLDLMDPRLPHGPVTEVKDVSGTVQREVRPLHEKTGPTTRPGATTGQFLTVGGVVAEVNGQPIYANKVLKSLEPALAARAQELDEAQFRKAASELIARQIHEFIRAELEYAAADHNLSADEKRIADYMTQQWRERQIAEAGGSLELAKKKAAAEGYNFDELVQDQYRLHLTQVYYQKKVIPKIQVTAADIRAAYEKNKATQFSEKDAARFRLIKVDVQKSGGREKALEKAKDLLEKARAGQDFSELAKTNDDANLMRNGGDVGWIEKGAWANEQVAEAVWATEKGKVTDIIDSGNAFWIAYVEDRRLGKVQPFEDPVVQERIRDALRAEQFRILREQEQKKLEEAAFIRMDEKMITTAIEMAMQRYREWAA